MFSERSCKRQRYPSAGCVPYALVVLFRDNQRAERIRPQYIGQLHAISPERDLLARGVQDLQNRSGPTSIILDEYIFTLLEVAIQEALKFGSGGGLRGSVALRTSDGQDGPTVGMFRSLVARTNG